MVGIYRFYSVLHRIFFVICGLLLRIILQLLLTGLLFVLLLLMTAQSDANNDSNIVACELYNFRNLAIV